MNETKKPRFVLIDPSAIHMGGHHYEYAARILRDAKLKEYDAELWAHRKSDLPEDEFPVFSVFQKSFYQNFTPFAGLAPLRNLRNKSNIRRLLESLNERVLDRLLPFFMESRLGLDAARAYHDSRVVGVYKPGYYSPQNAVKTSVVTYAFFFILFKLTRLVKDVLNRRSVKWALKILALILLVMLLPVFVVVGLLGAVFLMIKLQSRPVERIFADDMAHAMRARGPWQENDILFVPTCFTTEIKGLGVLLAQLGQREILPQFHMLFRTNVFSGYPEGFREQMGGWLDYRLSFKWLRDTQPHAKIVHYTDTPQLAAQYKVLADETFTVLPVPVPWMPREAPASAEARPLNVVYVGDVRDEKGYFHYPKMIEALWNEFVAPGKVTFTLQSNFADNLDVSRESAVAQSMLMAYPPETVRHVAGPMSSAAYQDLIESADVVLITYKPDHYLARSSGIFIEAMKAGKAVLMPATTWMASLVEPYRQTRWRDAAASYQSVSSSVWEAAKTRKLDLQKGHVVIDARFSAGSEAGFIEWTIRGYDARDNLIDDDIRVQIVQFMEDGRCTAMLPLPADSARVEIGYKLLGTTASMLSADIRHSGEAWQGAEDFAAGIYAYDDPKLVARKLREILRHIDIYKADAMRFAAERGPAFTPEALVDRVIAKAGGA